MNRLPDWADLKNKTCVLLICWPHPFPIWSYIMQRHKLWLEYWLYHKIFSFCFDQKNTKNCSFFIVCFFFKTKCITFPELCPSVDFLPLLQSFLLYCPLFQNFFTLTSITLNFPQTPPPFMKPISCSFFISTFNQKLFCRAKDTIFIAFSVSKKVG